MGPQSFAPATDPYPMKRGYIALTAILIILAVTLTVAMSANLLSIDSGTTDLALTTGKVAFGAAEACIEEALIQLRSDANYLGSNLNLDDASCTMTVTGTGAERTIDATGVAERATQTISVRVELNPTFSIISWTSPSTP